MPIRVDRSSPLPLYFQVAQHLVNMIESGELPMGTRLETETGGSGKLGGSRTTPRRAKGYQVDSGLLVSRRGIWTQIVHARITREVELTTLYEHPAKAGRAPATKVTSFRTAPAPAGVTALLV